MKKLQKGRSMLEMLAVLAIVGMLSIGGLASYSIAMNRLRTNSIMEYVTSCIVTAQAKEPSRFARGVDTTDPMNLDCKAVLKREYPSSISDTGEILIYDYELRKEKTRVQVKGLPPKVIDTIMDRFRKNSDEHIVAEASGCSSGGASDDTVCFTVSRPSKSQ